MSFNNNYTTIPELLTRESGKTAVLVNGSCPKPCKITRIRGASKLYICGPLLTAEVRDHDM